MSDEVRLAAILVTGIVLVLGMIIGAAFGVHAGNVKVATACVQSGGQWLDSRKDAGNGGAQMECVRA